MEDEEGYMALKPRPRNEASTYCSQVQTTEGVSNWSKHSKISLWAIRPICVFLGLALIVLTVLLVNAHEFLYCEKERRESSACTEDIIIELCEPLTGDSKCKLCPINWTSLKEKCYWFSKDKKDWISAYSGCTRKNAQMLVVLDLEEMDFIQNVTEENYPVWIGLNFTSLNKKWTWVDSSVLDSNLFSLPSPTTGMSCGVVKGEEVRSEMCSAEFRWICEKEVIVF